MLPLRCDTERRFAFPSTIILMCACCGVFSAQAAGHVPAGGFVPIDFMHACLHPGPAALYALLSCAIAFFMHGGLMHLVSNMWFLWIFGTSVEGRLGTAKFFPLYMGCGAIAMVAQALHAPYSAIPVVGASGAIAGVMGAHLVLIPFARILTWIPPIFIVRIPSIVFLAAWFYVQYASTRSPGESMVAWWAHIGGFIAGGIWGFAYRTFAAPAPKQKKKS